jgi:hypothetical protein
MSADTAGPVIVWENYGCEGWHPKSFPDLKVALPGTFPLFQRWSARILLHAGIMTGQRSLAVLSKSAIAPSAPPKYARGL